jgi:AcrR family transcriptional regulator
MRPEPAHIEDGRLRKGELRRRLLLDATVRVIGRNGVGAVSQRAVAREAQLPPSAVLYYFATVDDLLVTTLTMVNDGYIDRFEALPGDDDQALAALADLIADGTGAGRCAAIAEYELWLMAARRPGMRGELDRRARTPRPVRLPVHPRSDRPVRHHRRHRRAVPARVQPGRPAERDGGAGDPGAAGPSPLTASVVGPPRTGRSASTRRSLRSPGPDSDRVRALRRRPGSGHAPQGTMRELTVGDAVLGSPADRFSHSF